MNIQKKLILLFALLLTTVGLQTANAQCMANFTSSETGGVATFVNNSTGVTAQGFAYWDFGDGNTDFTSATAGNTHTYQVNGYYLACLTVTDSLSGCTSTFCDSVLVSGASAPPCYANFTFFVNGGAVIFSNTSSNLPPGATATWDFGDGNTASTGGTAGTNHTYAANGTYNVCLTVNGNNCSDTQCYQVTITGIGGGGNCSALFTATESGGVATFVNNSTGLGAGSVAVWDFGDGNFFTATPGTAGATHTYANNGAYIVCLTVQDSLGNCTDTYCDSLLVTGAGTGPTPCSVNYTWVNDSSQAYTILVFNNSTGNGALTYLWDFGDGTTSTQAFPSHVYAGAGTYVVCLTITDQTPCTSVFCDSIAVTYKTNVPFSINVVDPTATGIEAPQPEIGLLNYPNPFGDKLFVEYELDKPQMVTLELLDITGRVVLSREIDGPMAGGYQHQLNTRDLKKGMYMLRISGEEFSEVRKMMK